MITIYDKLLMEADNLKLITKEKNLQCYDGRLLGNKIAIRKSIPTNSEKACILAEELGHYHTTVGNILCQSSTLNRKQEHRARLWAYNKLIGLNGIVNAYKNGCYSVENTADYLNITENFLIDALECYKSKYGKYALFDNYVIYFEPSIGVLELI